MIDNPWSNALDRARRAGAVLANVLIERSLGVRPITLIGFSLGARVIFYALIELAKQKAFGIVQDVFLLGATVTASTSTWFQTRSVVSGRYVNAFAKNDWVLNYLFRATSGGINAVAGLRPIENVPGLENVDVTDKIAGHMSYRAFMPLILDQLGFPVFADYFDEPEVCDVFIAIFCLFLRAYMNVFVFQEPDFEEDRIVVREEEGPKSNGWFSRKKKPSNPLQKVSRPPTASSFGKYPRKSGDRSPTEDDLPPRLNDSTPPPLPPENKADPSTAVSKEAGQSNPDLPLRAGFDLDAIKEVLAESEQHPEELHAPQPTRIPPIATPTQRSASTPRPFRQASEPPNARSSLDLASSLDGRGRSFSEVSQSLRGNELDGDDGEVEEPAFSPPVKSPLAFRPPVPPFPFDSSEDTPWSSKSPSETFVRQPSLTFGNVESVITSYDDDPSTSFAYLHPQNNTRFASLSPPASLTQLSLGTMNDPSASPGLADPWGSRTASGKKNSAISLNANPWS